MTEKKDYLAPEIIELEMAVLLRSSTDVGGSGEGGMDVEDPGDGW